MSSNNAYRYERTIMTYAGVVNHRVRGYAIETIIASADEDIRNFIQSCLMLWKFSQKL